jgi:hypothetical protein
MLRRSFLCALLTVGGFQTAAKKHFNKVLKVRDDYGNHPNRGHIDDKASEKAASPKSLDPFNSVHDCQIKCNFGLTTVTCFRGLSEVCTLKWSKIHLSIQWGGQFD